MRNYKNKTILYFLISVVLFSITMGAKAESVERGIVKEYHGKEQKSSLPGVELIVKGAQSTVSDSEGNFELRFTILEPGAKVNYMEIYKEGYVIFNKDALDSWRISNNGRPFTIVMCKEADFRALKKKFYGIIEKSYFNEFQRQKELAQQTIAENMELDRKLRELEKQYQDKMSNINTYVELFSRIDHNEMDSIEAKSLAFLEAGQIDEAIQTFEELQLSRRMHQQFDKLNAAGEMMRAAAGMESEAQSDLLELIGKMQRQISLYEMGGYKYNFKSQELSDNLITLLQRIKPITGDLYNELLAVELIKKGKNSGNEEKLKLYREAAYLPSVRGLVNLAKEYEMWRPNQLIVDTIREFYLKALEIAADKQDTLMPTIKNHLREIPENFYTDQSGVVFPFRITENNEAVLMGYGPNYSTHIEGDVKLPDYVDHAGEKLKVTGVGEFAFGRNRSLKSVKFPRFCRIIEKDAFMGCDSLIVFINPYLEEIAGDTVILNQGVPLSSRFVIEETPKNIDWLQKRYEILEKLDYESLKVNMEPMNIAWGLYCMDQGYTEEALNGLNWVIGNYVNLGDFDKAFEYAEKLKSIDKKSSHSAKGYINWKQGDIKKAITEMEKGNKDVSTLNYLAYVYTDPKNPDKNFKKAHAALDMAIEIANDEELQNLLDSKGEIYLIEGNETDAEEYWNKIKNEYPEYYKEVDYSNLDKYFKEKYGVEETTPAMSDEEWLDRLCDRNLAIANIAIDFIRPRIAEIQPEQADSLFNEILIHITYYTLNDSEVNKLYEDAYNHFTMQIGGKLYKYAQENGIPYKNEWIGSMDSDGKNDFDGNAKYYSVCLIGIKQGMEKINTHQLVGNDRGRILSYMERIKGVKTNLNEKENILIDSIMSGKDVDFLTNEFNCSKDSLANFIINFVNRVYDYDVSDLDVETLWKQISKEGEERYTSMIDEIKKKREVDKNIFQKWIDLVKECAYIEMESIPEIENFRSCDFEELNAIGIIAFHVLLENKPQEKLKKYNVGYIATALRWAIKNELKIRYPWYRTLERRDIESMKVSPDTRQVFLKELNWTDEDISKFLIRIVVYKTIAHLALRNEKYRSFPNDTINVYHTWGLIDPERNLQALWHAVIAAKENMPEEYLDSYRWFFESNTVNDNPLNELSVEKTNSMLNIVREKIIENGLTAF